MAETIFTRRQFLKFSVGGLCAAALPLRVWAQEPAPAYKPPVHGLSAFGDLKYPLDFNAFSYVNPQAPKGGIFSQSPPSTAFNQNFNTFNSLNMFILRGDGAYGMDATFDSLMVRALDEPDALYGLVAESVEVSEDGRFYRFNLRKNPHFHDGTPLTAEDVAFSILLLKEKGHPLLSQSLRELVSVKAENERQVLVEFSPSRARDLPLLVAGLPIFSKTYYTEKLFDQTSLEAPLGSGAYKVKRFEVGRFIEFERVKDYWGKDLPVSQGIANFDILRYEYFRDRDVAFEAFKGRAYYFREEFTSRTWANSYNFPAFNADKVVKKVLPNNTPSGAQGWFFNLRRDKFKDPRVREALMNCFDFEWTNANLMFNAYERTHSLFQNSNLMATGTPTPEERAVLEPFRGQLSSDVFGEPFSPPVSDGSGQDRNAMRRANDLLNEAGWTLQSGKRVNAEGMAFQIEFLDFDPGLEPHTMAFINNLRRLGVAATIRRVDPAQYQSRLNNFDFDMTSRRYALASTPGESLQNMLSSRAADVAGSHNIAGIAHPVVDALLDQIIAVESRERLIVLCHALDRVLRAERFWVPHWFKASYWLAVWDVFGHPEQPPAYDRGAPLTWWWDEEKAKKTL